MEVERGTTSTMDPTCRNVEGYDATHTGHSQGGHLQSNPIRNIEIDWREVDPYFSELSDCASFWTLINFTCDVIYSGLFVLFFIMGQDVESMFFEGLLNHINPILIYLILSLTINYGALRSLRCGREKCFLMFSIMKVLLFPVTMSLLVYLVFFDVQEYFGTFWISFVVIVSCYNGTAALGLWSMFTCNKYILVNEAAQKRLRNQAKQQRSNDANCLCPNSPSTSAMAAPATNCENNQNLSRPSATSNVIPVPCGLHPHTCHNDLPESSANLVVCKPECSVDKVRKGKCNRIYNEYQRTNESCACGPSWKGNRNISGNLDVISFGDEDEVLQISTVHKVMQEIRLLDSNSNPDDISDGESI